IDACRDVPDSGSDFRIKSGTRKRQDSFAQHKLFQQATGTRILFSTKAGGVSWEHPELQHSVFTYFLLEGLRGAAVNSQGLITFRSLADYVEIKVPAWTIDKRLAQKPYTAGEGSGWFLLAKTSTTPAIQSPVTSSAPSISPPPTTNALTAQIQAETARLAKLRQQREAEEARLKQIKVGKHTVL
ncbi:hypothetical protein TI05_19080, partial [Achromatium sp. WMS3]